MKVNASFIRPIPIPQKMQLIFLEWRCLWPFFPDIFYVNLSKMEHFRGKKKLDSYKTLIETQSS